MEVKLKNALRNAEVKAIDLVFDLGSTCFIIFSDSLFSLQALHKHKLANSETYIYPSLYQDSFHSELPIIQSKTWHYL